MLFPVQTKKTLVPKCACDVAAHLASHRFSASAFRLTPPSSSLLRLDNIKVLSTLHLLFFNCRFKKRIGGFFEKQIGDRKPNQTVLGAQTRVCTGPTQTKPLTEEQAFKVLDTILRSAKGELKDEEHVSKAQLGAFFAAMTIRANIFPEATQWSEGERRAMDTYWPLLVRNLPSDIIFLADPEGSIMRLGSSIGPQYVGNRTHEMSLVGCPKRSFS
ncbi:hypothetical protein L1887_18237 [Cichorium endivia]|nr:hypothetical protein L1887_18237 [Cichorium endivia]